MGKFKFRSKTIRFFWIALPIVVFGSYLLVIGSIFLALMVQFVGVLAVAGITVVRMVRELLKKQGRIALTSYLHMFAVLMVFVSVVSLFISQKVSSDNQHQEMVTHARGDGSLTEQEQITDIDWVSHALGSIEKPTPDTWPANFIEQNEEVSYVGIGGGEPDNNPNNVYDVVLSDESEYCLRVDPSDKNPALSLIGAIKASEFTKSGQYSYGTCDNTEVK